LARVGEQLVPLDAERLAQRYRQPVPFSDGARRSNLAYLALSVVLLAAVVVVALQWRQERAGAARMAFVSAAPQPVEPPHVTVASTASAPQIPPPQTQAPQVQAPQLQTPPAPSAARLERTADAPPPAGWGRLVLQFEDESWVEVYSGTGKLLVAQLHAEGTERVVTGVPPFSLVIGNAQRVRLSYNDKPVDLMPHVRVEVARFTLK
jgi:cytoskeleton protein RodZ